jgi:hypothetical protein
VPEDKKTASVGRSRGGKGEGAGVIPRPKGNDTMVADAGGGLALVRRRQRLECRHLGENRIGTIDG